MTFINRASAAFISLVFCLIVPWGTQAQSGEPDLQTAFFIAPALDGIPQIFRTTIGSTDNENEQISFADKAVQTFGVAPDGVTIAYISDAKLWLQRIGADEAEMLTAFDSDSLFSMPIFSANSQTLAYASETGAWVMNLETRESNRILENQPFNAVDGTFIFHEPRLFVPNSDAEITKLIVEVIEPAASLPAGVSVGIYDLKDETLKIVAEGQYAHLLPVSDGSALLYTTTSLTEHQETLTWFYNLDAPDENISLFNLNTMDESIVIAQHAVEISPGIIRVSGIAAIDAEDISHAFYLDIDLKLQSLSDIVYLQLEQPGILQNAVRELSPDGRFLFIYSPANWGQDGVLSGSVFVYDLEQEKLVDTDLPAVVSQFTWGP